MVVLSLTFRAVRTVAGVSGSQSSRIGSTLHSLKGERCGSHCPRPDLRSGPNGNDQCRATLHELRMEDHIGHLAGMYFVMDRCLTASCFLDEESVPPVATAVPSQIFAQVITGITCSGFAWVTELMKCSKSASNVGSKVQGRYSAHAAYPGYCSVGTSPH